MINLHVHTWRCRHATGTAAEMAGAAARQRLRVLGFAEHAPLPVEIDQWHVPLLEWPAYVAEVQEAQVQYPELEILLGMEIDYLPEFADYLRDFASQQVFDYVIGSVHYIDGWNFDFEDEVSAWNHRDPMDVYARYYELVREAVATGVFQVVGHLDLPKKFGHRMPAEAWEHVEKTLDTIRQAGVVLEVNTAGLRCAVGEPYPEVKILQRAAEIGIPITLGTDAHNPEDIAADLDRTGHELVELGFRDVVYFRQRERITLPLAELVTR